ncbi:MAG: UDP-3-O-acyl-N-acetylglucosamine deacetylase, partial [Candidatus Methylomirabilis sp.]|nr:UDP-3-O-acyl-N-acetylglucosamine deacetylase [Deltaproteobacteria bacterium]
MSFSGVGLHSGERIDARIRPAPPGAGIVFIRTDLPTRQVIPAVREALGDTTLATTLGVGEARISTVEHLMAALMALGVDNAR